MRHRFDAGDVDCLHLLDEAEYARQLPQRSPGLGIINRDPRQVRNAPHIVERQGHEQSEKTIKNEGWLGYHIDAPEGIKIR